MAEKAKETGLSVVKSLFSQDNVKERFEELLGSKAPGFISSVLQIMQNDKYLADAKPQTILNAAATAAILDLPINQNLGFAWIVPYKGEAQFQMGWKGFVQLALRSGHYESINVIDIQKSQFKSFDPIAEELDVDMSIEDESEIIGYAGFIKLKNGFKKTVYWSKVKVTNHAKKYSKAFNSKFSPWQDPILFHAMARKTVLKNMISKWGIMSIEMQTAHISDQAVIENPNNPRYPDNEPADPKEQKENLGGKPEPMA